MDAQTRQVYIDTNTGQDGPRQLTDDERVLPIPRRPGWHGLSPEQLREAENKSFLEWRRQLATLQVNYSTIEFVCITTFCIKLFQEETDCVVTPYEKNLEFWRQLWRVIERSDLIVQIVDCRHPLMFRSQDLEKYVKEVSELKQNLLLVNKSDFLTLDQRKAWAEHFRKENIKFAFFSAITEDEDSIHDELDSVSKTGTEHSEQDSEEAYEDDTANNKDIQKDNEVEDPSLKVLSSTQLLELFR